MHTVLPLFSFHSVLSVLETSGAWCTVICGQKSLVKMLFFSEVDCFLWGAEERCQAVKETKTCRLSLPIASFHRLPETNTVHRADLVLGPSPWFPRFAWPSRRQQTLTPPPLCPPRHQLRNASAVPSPPTPLSTLPPSYTSASVSLRTM